MANLTFSNLIDQLFGITIISQLWFVNSILNAIRSRSITHDKENTWKLKVLLGDVFSKFSYILIPISITLSRFGIILFFQNYLKTSEHLSTQVLNFQNNLFTYTALVVGTIYLYSIFKNIGGFALIKNLKKLQEAIQNGQKK